MADVFFYVKGAQDENELTEELNRDSFCPHSSGPHELTVKIIHFWQFRHEEEAKYAGFFHF